MNRDAYNKIKALLKIMERTLKEGSHTEEEKQKLEISLEALSGQLSSIWWPFDWVRRSIMIALFLVGLYGGLIVGSFNFLWAWAVILFFSPRIVGFSAYFIGRSFGVLSRINRSGIN